MKKGFSIWRVLIVTTAVILVVGGAAWYKGFFQSLGLYRPSNSLMVLMPYQYQKEGWLCPGLFKYYKEAPKEIYVKAEKK